MTTTHLTVQVAAINDQWTSTDIHVHTGDSFVVQAFGMISVHPGWQSIGSEGLDYLPPDFNSDLQFLFPPLAHYALVAKIGDHGTPFVVGSSVSHIADSDGPLSFWINETNGSTDFTDNTGAFSVSIEVTQSSKAALDDLTRIEGIGPQIAALLQGAGITTFAQLATSAVDQLQTILREGGNRFSRADPGSWPEQATLAAAGKWQEFEQLLSRLNAGRK